MSKQEIENLSDESLIEEWEQIKNMYKNRLQIYLSNQQGNILFADFVNVSTEMNKRKLIKTQPNDTR